MARRRPSRGRQRIEIRRIEDEQARYVCFSKRRPGLFKKCSELAILCGTEVAAVVFSPATTDKAFSFGHPSVEAIIERFDPTGILVGAGATGEDCEQLVQLNRRFAEQVDMEKARKERAEAAMAKERAKANPLAKWLQADVRDMGKEELMAYSAALAKVKAAVAARNQMFQDRAMAATARAGSSYIIRQALLAPPHQFLRANHGRAMTLSSNNNYQVQTPPPQQFLLANNNYQVQAPPPQQFLLANNNYQVQAAPPPQQFILSNHGAGFLYQFGAGSANNNAAADMDMQIQQMMRATVMPPPLGFAGAGMEMMMLPQGFGGFPGPY